VLTSALKDGGDAEEIYLGDNEHFKVGDIVEVTPVSEAETRIQSSGGTIDKTIQAHKLK
jgi:hypothetical protein